MRKVSNVNKAARAEGTLGSRHQRVSFQMSPPLFAPAYALASVVKEGRKT